MEDIDWEIRVEAERAKKRRKFTAAGHEVHVCISCPQSDPLCLTIEHLAGRNHDDTTTLMCWNCKAVRDAEQRAEPSGCQNPRNPFEVIGRWLLGMAGYFGILVTTLRRFGEWLINVAKAGYGDDLCFDW